MGMTAGDLNQASDWTRELVDSILYRQNRHEGVPRWVATAMFDWMKSYWRIGFREEDASLKTTVWLMIPDEYGSTPAWSPNLRFDDLVDAIRDRWKSGGELLLADFEEQSLHTLGNTFGNNLCDDHFVVDGGFRITQGRTSTAVNSAGTHVSYQPRGPKVGDIITMDGQKMRVISVSTDGVNVSLAPVENTRWLSPELEERARREEDEAREIMLEALRRAGR